MNNPYIVSGALFLSILMANCGVLRIRDFPEQIKADKNALLTANLTYLRNSVSPEELSPPLIEKWSEEFMSLPFNGFTAVDNWLLFGTYNGYLVVADIGDGDMKGKRNLGDACAAPPTVQGQLIFQSFETGSYGLVAYDVYHGRIEWRLEGHHSRSAPVVIDNKVLHVSLQGEIVCLNIEEGEEIWRIALQSEIRNSPSFSGDKLIIATLSGKIFALEYTSGVVVWETAIDGPIVADPVIEGEKIYVAGQMRDLYVFSLSTGREIHRQKINIPMYFPPTIDSENIYLPLSDGQIICLDKSTYKEKWIHAGEGPAAGPALVSRSYIYQASLAEKLYILDKSNGSILQEIGLTGRARSAPIIKNGNLIISCENKQVIAYAKE